MKILYASGEAAPFAVSGGLGDVMGALPAAVSSLLGEGNEVSVILPLYASVLPLYREKMEVECDLSFSLSWRRTGCRIYRLVWGGVTYLFVENHYYFDRPRMYGEMDDGERFAFFSRAVIEFMLQKSRVPDVLHCNDWQTALAIIQIKTLFRNHPAFDRLRTVYTIHNIEYQGKYGMDMLGDVFGLSDEFRGAVEYDGCINLTKGAIVLCDKLNTVSPRYAEELCDPYFAFGLSAIISENSYKFAGIINGIDVDVFRPSGEDIPVPYTAKNAVTGKGKNKEALQEELGLPVKKDVPLLVMITRLTEGKGVDLVLRILEELLQDEVQFVLLGTGDACYEEAFSEICGRYPEKARALIKFDRALSKRMYASADVFLMPSKTEPCGLSQMIACRYGAIPVVRDVGGLHDSIPPVGSEGGCGYRVETYNAHELLFRIREALALYKNRPAWRKLISVAMAKDFTWQASAREYIRFYQE